MVNKQADRSRERAREDYLKAIYHLGSGAPVKPVLVARHLGVSRASVSKLRRVLERDGLLQSAHKRVDALQLTARGLALAMRMVRRHRLVETFLHRSLGVPLARVHADAERIEHSISDDIARRLASFLGNPACDPHGHAITPLPRGAEASRSHALSEIPAGSRIIVSAVDDRDPQIMRRVVALGLLPQRRAVVMSSTAQHVRVRGSGGIVSVPGAVAQSVRCLTLPEAKIA